MKRKNTVKWISTNMNNEKLSYFTTYDEKICFHATFLFASPIIINICKSSLLYFSLSFGLIACFPLCCNFLIFTTRYILFLTKTIVASVASVVAVPHNLG